MLFVLRASRKPMLLVFRAKRNQCSSFPCNESVIYVVCEYFSDKTNKKHIAYMKTHKEFKLIVEETNSCHNTFKGRSLCCSFNIYAFKAFVSN